MSIAAAKPSANVVDSDLQAIELARELAGELAVEDGVRDAERRLPRAELARVAESGLLAISVPREHGGADVPFVTLAEVVRLLATADSNLAQIPHSHFVYVNVLREVGSPAQRRLFFGEVLAGRVFGNAQAEIGIKGPAGIRTRLQPGEDGGYVLTGTKHFCTGALFADWVPVLAKAPDDRLHAAFVHAGSPGLSVIDDWDGIGQRTTASGTVQLREVSVPGEHVVPYHLMFARPQLHGALAQLLHAAIDTGIARAALADAQLFVRRRTHPWWESQVEQAGEDQLLVQRFGELEVQVRAAEALLREAARELDGARALLTDDSAAGASIAVAAAKVFVDRACVELGSALFEVCGASSSREGENLSRHWRNARTHTLHDPVRWKVQHVGRYALNGTLPPRGAHI